MIGLMMECPDITSYIIVPHADLEMKRRGISADTIDTVLRNPTIQHPVRPGRCVYQAQLAFDSPPKFYLVRIFVDVDRQPYEVVTVYRTSKIQKYMR